MRWPSTANSAGRIVSAASIATSVAAIAPILILRKNISGKSIRPNRLVLTVRPEKATVLPAVAIVLSNATFTSPLPCPNSSRKRVTMKSA